MQNDNWILENHGEVVETSLLQCLLLLARYHQKPTSAKALVAGLPLVNNQLTPDLFVRAAARAGLTAQIVKRPLAKITAPVLPAVLLLNDQKACIVVEFTKNHHVKVVYPETGAGVTEIPLRQLNKMYSGYAIYLRPVYEFSDRSEETLEPKKRDWFWSTLWKAVPVYREVLIASFLINAFALASPLFVMNVYDRVVPNHAIETLWVLAIGVITVFCFDFLLRGLRGYFIDMAGKNIDIQLSASIFEQVLGIKMAARPTSVGAFANTVNAFESFREFITSATASVLVDLPFALLYIAIIAMIGGSLAWVPILTMPLVMVVGFFIQIPLDRLVQESYRYATEKHATLIEALNNVEVIKSMSAESILQRRWENLICNLAKLGVKTRLLANGSINFSIFSQYMTSILIVIAGVYKISAGEITTGALIACTILTGRALVPISQIAGLLTRYHQSVTALKSVDKVMQQPVERPFGKRFLHRPNLQGNIEFRSVTFNYPNQTIPALKSISFKIQAGERVGIIGRIGSGKTTLEKLIMGLYQPTAGSILVDETDLQHIDPADLRHHFGYVPQDAILFYGSVRDNLMLGLPTASDEQILRATEIATIAKFVKQHPQGFDLQVGERGSCLSGGQRQSISVARSLMLDPPVLLMDEPSNDMDDATEAQLKANLTNYLPNKTLLLITHRASMLTLVNRLIVMDAGQIVADGPKDVILKNLTEGKVNAAKV